MVKRTTLCRFLVTVTEKQLIERAAAVSGVKMSDLVRGLVLPVAHRMVADKEVVGVSR